MKASDMKIIRAFAAGDQSKRKEAIIVHRAFVDHPSYQKTVEFEFMRDVDNPCPDLALRAYYRALLVGGEKGGR